MTILIVFLETNLELNKLVLSSVHCHKLSNYKVDKFGTNPL